MKYFFISLLLTVTCSGFSQAFHRGAVVIDFNTGVEAYSTVQKYGLVYAAPPHDTTVNSQAANTNFSMGIEVGLGKHFGIGLRGKANSFIDDVDAVTRNLADVRSTDMVLSLNIHPVVRKKFDLLLGADLGISNLTFKFTDKEGIDLNSLGRFAAPYLNPRLYLGRFGFNLKMYVPFVKYDNFNAELVEGNSKQFLLSDWKGLGFGASIGIQLRLF